MLEFIRLLKMYLVIHPSSGVYEISNHFWMGGFPNQFTNHHYQSPHIKYLDLPSCLGDAGRTATRQLLLPCSQEYIFPPAYKTRRDSSQVFSRRLEVGERGVTCAHHFWETFAFWPYFSSEEIQDGSMETHSTWWWWNFSASSQPPWVSHSRACVSSKCHPPTHRREKRVVFIQLVGGGGREDDS